MRPRSCWTYGLPAATLVCRKTTIPASGTSARSAKKTPLPPLWVTTRKPSDVLHRPAVAVEAVAALLLRDVRRPELLPRGGREDAPGQQRLGPAQHVVGRRVDAAVGAQHPERAVLGERAVERRPPALARLVALRHPPVAPAGEHVAGLVEPVRQEEPLAHEALVRAAGQTLDDGAEQAVAGVRVLVAAAGREGSGWARMRRTNSSRSDRVPVAVARRGPRCPRSG